MRIGLLIYGDIQSLSGGYFYNRQLLDYLCCQGDSVEIVSLPYRRYASHLTDNFSNALLKRIAAAELDLLIEDAMAHPSLFWLNRRLARRLKLPLVALVHLLSGVENADKPAAGLYRAIERRYLQSVSGIIANSRTTLAQVSQMLNGRLPAHCLAPPAADHVAAVTADTLSERARQAGPLRILAVGNVIQRKGLQVLVEALGHLPRGDYRTTLAGRLDLEPAYVSKLRQTIRRHALSDRIELAGPVVGTDLAELYRTHQLMALPSSYESYGIVYAEALRFGLPAIATTGGAAWEIIRSGETGFLIAPGDAAELAERLRYLHGDRDRLARLSHNALAASTQLPTWQDCGATIRRFLRECLTSGS